MNSTPPLSSTTTQTPPSPHAPPSAPFDTLIVGAGISGLLAATQLQSAGQRVVILEKGRGFGGRMATRRMDDAVLDHGAQFFTVRHHLFARLVEAWKAAGLVRPWFFGEPDSADTASAQGGHPRYFGPSGMTAVPKFLGERLDVRRSTQATQAHRLSNGLWQITCSDGSLFFSQNLLLTAPVPQSLALLETSALPSLQPHLDALRAVRYTRCITALVPAPQINQTALPPSGACKLSPPEPLEWIADNHRKGLSPVPAFTLQSGPEFAEAHWDSPDAVRLPPLLEAAQPFVGELPLSQAIGHRWGFSKPLVLFPQNCLHLPQHGLAFAGDAFDGPRIEGAALSGLAAAQNLLKGATHDAND